MVSGRVTFELLPPEIREHILLFLDRRSLFAASSVSKSWYRAISPVTAVWRRACQSLDLQIREGIDGMMCRALFMRLVQRWRSIQERRCFHTRSFEDRDKKSEVTAVYYNNRRLATSFQDGKIALWNCSNSKREWTSVKHSSSVVSIKFDDSILLASYYDGSLASWNCSTGLLQKIYCNKCVHAPTVDYLTDANIVVSAYDFVVGWNMSSGDLILAVDLERKCATKIVIKPYPDGEVKVYPTVRKMLIASIVRDHLLVYLATSTGESRWKMEIDIRTLGAFWVGAPKRPLFSSAADEIYFDGKFLYFAKRLTGQVHKAAVIQWDVVNTREVTELKFWDDILTLAGVGEKYIMVITADKGLDHLEIMDRQCRKVIMASPIDRYSTNQFMQPGSYIFCHGARSWLDGFDGNNDSGAIAFFVSMSNQYDVLEWKLRNDQRFLRRRYRRYKVNNIQT